MTRKLVLTNMSNGDNEDFVIQDRHGLFAQGERVIQPGESIDISYSDKQSEGSPAYAFPANGVVNVRTAINNHPDKQGYTYRAMFIVIQSDEGVVLPDEQDFFTQDEVDLLATQHRRAIIQSHSGQTNKKYTRSEVQSILDAIEANPKHRQ